MASHLINCNQEKERSDGMMVQRNFYSQSSQLFEKSDKLEGNSAVKPGASFKLIPSSIALNDMRLTTTWRTIVKYLLKCRG